MLLGQLFVYKHALEIESYFDSTTNVTKTFR